jgi:transposase
MQRAFLPGVRVGLAAHRAGHFHGGKAKSDRIDSQKIAVLLRGGIIPVAYVYPPEMRSTRDLLRRRTYLTRKRAELLVHVQHTHSQYNLPEIGKKIAYRPNRSGVAERFSYPAVQTSIETDLTLIDFYDTVLNQLELFITRQVKDHDSHAFYLLRTVPGIVKILALTILYEIHPITRFPRVQEFVSYCRLVKRSRQSAGNNYGFCGKKIGNVHLKWAFSQAAVLFLRNNPKGQKLLTAGKKTWQGKSPHRSGSQAGTSRLFQASQGESP